MSVRLAIGTTIGTLGWLSLAIWGGGGVAKFFSHPPLIALTIVLLAMGVVALFSPATISSGEREDRSNRWIFIPIAVITLLAGYLPAFTDRIGFWTLDGDTTRWFGVILFALGGVLRLWPTFVLGRRFSGLVAIQPGHTLVTTGIYSIIRHPSYLGLLMMALGWALAFRSLIGVLLAALMVPILVNRIHSEENLLQSQFGYEYDAYRARTSRLIPGLY